MPTYDEWKRVFTDLKAKLNLPCRLRMKEDVKIGRHLVQDWDLDDGTEAHVCYIDINPDVDFRVPEHLILHEAAHCRANAFDEYHGHDEMWAEILLRMYREADIALPQTTSFLAFAKVAGIERKNFVREK